MKNKVYITARIRENYGDEHSPHWKIKGARKFIIEMDSDLILYDYQNQLDMFRELVEQRGNAHIQFEFIDYKVECPIFDVFREYFYANEIEGMIKEGVIEISPLAYMRGRTFKDSFIIADEMQNATPNQMKMLLTRIGTNSKMCVTGDLAQADRLKDNGLLDFVNNLKEYESKRISAVYFKQKDIERHEAVKEVLQVYGDA